MSDSQTNQPPPNAPPVQPAGGPPVIPWQRRGKGLGRGRAYWRTVWLVIGRNGRLNDFLDGPVDYKDAQRFRRLTIAYALVLPAAVHGTIWVGGMVQSLVDGPDVGAALLMLLPLLAGLLVPIVALAGATGVVSWFFCPRHYDTGRQNRSIALSYYTCAPLALLSPALIAIGISAGVVGGLTESIPAAALIAIGGLTVLVIWWYQLILRAVHYIADRPGEQVVLVALLLPAAWALVELAMLIVPAGIVLLAIMYLSVT